MSQSSNKRERVRRMDSILILAALITAGAATVLFWAAWRSDHQAETIEITDTPTATITLSPTITASPTITPSWTPSATSTETPTRVLTDTPTNTPTFTPTFTPTLTDTPTATNTLTSTPTSTFTWTPSSTNTPYPEPLVNPIALAETYAGEAITITGEALPDDTITLLDNGTAIAEIQADHAGAWEIQLEEGLEAGGHRLELYASNGDGVQSVVIPLGFVVNNVPTPSPTRTPRPTLTPSLTPTEEISFVASATPTQSSSQRTQLNPTAVQIVSETPTAVIDNNPLSATAANSPLPATIDNNLLPITATPSPTLPTDTPTSTFTATPSPTITATFTTTATDIPELAPTLVPLPAPRFDLPQNPYSPFAPVLITGSSEPNTTITLSAGESVIGEAHTDARGNWQFIWDGDTFSTAIQAIASHESGRISEPTRATFAVELTAPVIDSPTSGRTIPPGSLTLSGTAPALAPITLFHDNTPLAETTADESGAWSLTITAREAGLLRLYAAIEKDVVVRSNIVAVTVAESIVPETGGLLDDGGDETGSAYTALLALLFTAGGFTLIFVGRALYMRSRT